MQPIRVHPDIEVVIDARGNWSLITGEARHGRYCCAYLQYALDLAALAAKSPELLQYAIICRLLESRNISGFEHILRVNFDAFDDAALQRVIDDANKRWTFES